MSTQTKRCTKCEKDKHPNDFHSGEHRHICKECVKEYSKSHAVFKKLFECEGGLHERMDMIIKKEVGKLQTMENQIIEKAIKSRGMVGHVYPVGLIAATDDFLRITVK